MTMHNVTYCRYTYAPTVQSAPIIIYFKAILSSILVQIVGRVPARPGLCPGL